SQRGYVSNGVVRGIAADRTGDRARRSHAAAFLSKQARQRASMVDDRPDHIDVHDSLPAVSRRPRLHSAIFRHPRHTVADHDPVRDSNRDPEGLVLSRYSSLWLNRIGIYLLHFDEFNSHTIGSLDHCGPRGSPWMDVFEEGHSFALQTSDSRRQI